VADGKGWITVDDPWRAQRRHNRNRLCHLSEPRYHLCSSSVRWHCFHRHCDPDLDADAYWIDIQRIRTLADLGKWSLHLSRKRWFERTDWPAFIRSHVMHQLEGLEP
jgi:hypothetical protein